MCLRCCMSAVSLPHGLFAPAQSVKQGLANDDLAASAAAHLHAGWGFVIWTLGSVGCGLATDFWTFLACRIIMGAGEASVVQLTGAWL